jgi:hypothetical protein
VAATAMLGVQLALVRPRAELLGVRRVSIHIRDTRLLIMTKPVSSVVCGLIWLIWCGF